MHRRDFYTVVLSVIAVIGLAIFFWGGGGPIRASADGMSVIGLALAGILVGAGALARGEGRPGRMMRDLLIWSGIIAGLAVGFAQWQERQTAPVGGEQLTLAAPAAAQQDASGSATIKKAADGHFWTEARVNGRTQRFMVDTGASYVALPLKDAKRLGVAPHKDDFTAQVQTANGMARAAPVILRDIRISGVTLRNVDAVVLSDGLDTALLGMSFLNRLESFEAKSDSLRLKS